jgi:hypothetical protein
MHLEECRPGPRAGLRSREPSVLALGAVGADSNIDSNTIAHPAAQAILHNLKLQGQNAMTRAGPGDPIPARLIR